jgi:hypothetical protein
MLSEIAPRYTVAPPGETTLILNNDSIIIYGVVCSCPAGLGPDQVTVYVDGADLNIGARLTVPDGGSVEITGPILSTKGVTVVSNTANVTVFHSNAGA